MFCPKCKTEYIEGIKMCADCKVPLVKELPQTAETAQAPAGVVPLHSDSLVMVFCSENSYDFVKAAEALKEAGIPIYGEEEYTGEATVGRRFPSPFRWTIFVDENLVEDARDALTAKGMHFTLYERTYGSSYEEETVEVAEDSVQVYGKPILQAPVRPPAQSQIVIEGDVPFRKFILLVIAFAVIGAVITLLKK